MGEQPESDSKVVSGGLSLLRAEHFVFSVHVGQSLLNFIFLS
jgi:hypothetical protein